jgi:hypothetical protein
VSEVSTVSGGYRYAGSLADAPARRRSGPGRSPLASRVLEALASLGGEATTTEIRAALEASGIVLSGRRRGSYRVPDALHRLAKTSPPAVMATGDRRGGQGWAQRWRLAQGGDGS